MNNEHVQSHTLTYTSTTNLLPSDIVFVYEFSLVDVIVRKFSDDRIYAFSLIITIPKYNFLKFAM